MASAVEPGRRIWKIVLEVGSPGDCFDSSLRSFATGLDGIFIVTDVLSSPAHPILWPEKERLQFVGICQ